MGDQFLKSPRFVLVKFVTERGKGAIQRSAGGSEAATVNAWNPEHYRFVAGISPVIYLVFGFDGNADVDQPRIGNIRRLMPWIDLVLPVEIVFELIQNFSFRLAECGRRLVVVDEAGGEESRIVLEDQY